MIDGQFTDLLRATTLNDDAVLYFNDIFLTRLNMALRQSGKKRNMTDAKYYAKKILFNMNREIQGKRRAFNTSLVTDTDIKLLVSSIYNKEFATKLKYSQIVRKR